MSEMRFHLLLAIIGTSLVGGNAALANDPIAEARGTASYIGYAVGAAMACQNVARPRIKSIADRLARSIAKFTTNREEVAALRKIYESNVTEGQNKIRSNQSTCASADTRLAYWERLTTVWLPEPLKEVAVIGFADAAEPTERTPNTTAAVPRPAGVSRAIHGVSQHEIRFGTSAPFTGPSKRYGMQLMLGTQTAFDVANDAGGIDGKKLTLFTADDGYDPSRTQEAIKQLYEKDQVFGFIGNFGTVAASISLPYALSHKALFFAPFTGANLVRRDPPDRYVFNYRPSSGEETAAIVQYLLKIRELRPEQIAVFTQQDGFGDAGFDGVAKAIRAWKPSIDASKILRLNYPRNTLDLDDAITQLQHYQRRHHSSPIKAVVMLAVYRPAAKFIERTRDLIPGLIYTSTSAVGATALAEELAALGPKYADGVIVTQVVPAVGGYSSIVLDYKAALAKYFPGEQPDCVSLEAYIQANILIEGLRRAGPNLDTEKLVGALESLHDIDMHLGARVNLSADDHQALHKVWGSQLNAAGHYQPMDLE